MTDPKIRVCPVELSGSLDSKIRRWLQNPQKLLSPYLTDGMKVLDVGCGPGFFSIDIAKMIGENGKVFSVDLQQGMLNLIRKKIAGTELESRIQLIKSEVNGFSIPEKVNFILAFYMVHEVPDKDNLFKLLKNTLLENGRFLLIEPKLFHVSKKEFESTLKKAEQAGFKITKGPKLPFSHSAILH
ncbi:MAG: class I SAM-dependent methyltransferase [Ignavibacteriales bacterium]|nr:class I SAM-dependent methyltransferase [Ignavibacteriales bacterium]